VHQNSEFRVRRWFELYEVTHISDIGRSWWQFVFFLRNQVQSFKREYVDNPSLYCLVDLKYLLSGINVIDNNAKEFLLSGYVYHGIKPLL
jgi:hypothetical protein